MVFSGLAKIVAKEKEAAEQQRKARLERERVDLADSRQRASRWVLGGAAYVWDARLILGTNLLRINPMNPNDVETSGGENVPLADVRRLLPLIQRAYSHGPSDETFVKTDHTRLGHFRLNRIDYDGTVYVGCHQFKRDEVERFIKVLDQLPAMA